MEEPCWETDSLNRANCRKYAGANARRQKIGPAVARCVPSNSMQTRGLAFSIKGFGNLLWTSILP